MGSLAAQGIAHIIAQPDAHSDEYIFENGSQEQIYLRLSENWLIDRCGLGAVRESEYLSKQCPQDARSETPRDCDAVLEKIRVQKKCKNHPTTRKAFREVKSDLDRQARARVTINHDKKIEEEGFREALKEIDKECGVHINPYRESLRTRLVNWEAHLIAEAMHKLKPSPEKVAAYNACVRSHSRASEELIAELSQEPRGLVDNAISKYDSFKCYNSVIQTKLYCEVASSVLGGGTISQLARRRLGRKQAARTTSSVATKEGSIPIRSCVPDDCHLEQVQLSKTTFTHVRDRHINENLDNLPQQAHLGMTKVKEQAGEINQLNSRRIVIQEELEVKDLDPTKRKELTREYQLHSMRVKELLRQNLGMDKLDKKKNSTFYTQGRTPEEVVSSLPQSKVERVHRGEHANLYRTQDESGVVYDFWVCRKPPCQVDGHDTDTANELLSIYPACGPGVLTLKSLNLIDKIIMNTGIDNVSGQDLYFTPPCP